MSTPRTEYYDDTQANFDSEHDLTLTYNSD
jgi:hypothetical protein